MSFNVTAFNQFEITGTVAPYGTTFKREMTPAIVGQKDNAPRIIFEVTTEVEDIVEVENGTAEIKMRKRIVFVSTKGDKATKELQKLAKKMKPGDTVKVAGNGFIDRSHKGKNGRTFWNHWITDITTLELV